MVVIERTPEAYAAAFEKERRNEYPVIDEFERRMGYAVDRDRLEAAARVLACPVKKNPPNWQHGRVIYALGRQLLMQPMRSHIWVDIGTAKGFSAVCMLWAMRDAYIRAEHKGENRAIWTYDVIDPALIVDRNSVNGPGSAYDFIDLFTNEYEHPGICAFHSDKLKQINEDISFAFIDGSHTYEGVRSDIAIVTPRQQSGDIMLFDDVNKPEVNRAVSELEGYDLEYIKLLPKRHYAIAVKR